MRTKGRVDNWNDYSVKSLNRTKRQQELLRVTHENQVCLTLLLKCTTLIPSGQGLSFDQGNYLYFNCLL
jgi:hypothetical protein